MCVVSLWISPFDYAVVCSGVKSVAQSDEQKYIFISDTCWTLLRQLCGVNAGFPIDLLLFHNSALPLVSCKVTGCVSQRSQGHCGFVCVSVCVCVCVRACVCLYHTWTTCWCPAWRASQSSARTSRVTCAAPHIVCEKVTELLSLEERPRDPVLFIDWHCVPLSPNKLMLPSIFLKCVCETLMCCNTLLMPAESST